ncbi:hypothetical protein TNCV_1985631 [Trichonephila clavipes]|nr:hypothetical protein TNCV_1985631 [Trichonephila clavipes]
MNYGALGQTSRVCFGVLCANRTREVKRDFCDLPMRRNEGRVVNTPLVFKRVLFQGKKESPGERTDGRRRRVDEKDGRERGRTGEETRGEDRRDGERKGQSPELE